MINRKEELKKLFEEWEKAHEKEPKPSRGRTFPKLNESLAHHKDFHRSFCYDGFFEMPVSGKKTLLFVCREANIKDRISGGELYPETTWERNCSDNFWMQEHFCVWAKKHSIKESSHDAYIEFIRQRVEEYGGLDQLNLAYMNLNKRGGVEKCDPTRLGHYVKRYHRFIRREIEIIAPDIIICGGTFDTIIDILTDMRFKLVKDMQKNELECRSFYHPSSPKNVCEKEQEAVKLFFGKKAEATRNL